MFRDCKVLVFLSVLVITSTVRISFAAMWQPYKFEPKDQEYEYKIVNLEEDTEKVSNYVLKIDKKDDGQLEVSVKTAWMASEEDLGSQILGGWWAAGPFGLTMAFINPMYAAFFDGLDLYVGNKMSFFGAGLVEVAGTEKVAGRSGFVCELREKDGGPVMGRYVVDPEVPLPLKSELFEEGGTKRFQTELQRIEI